MRWAYAHLFFVCEELYALYFVFLLLISGILFLVFVCFAYPYFLVNYCCFDFFVLYFVHCVLQCFHERFVMADKAVKLTPSQRSMIAEALKGAEAVSLRAAKAAKNEQIAALHRKDADEARNLAAFVSSNELEL